MSEVGRLFHLGGAVYLYTGQAIENNMSMKDEGELLLVF